MTNELWATYAQCWSASGDDRARVLADVTASDVRYRDPQAEAHGRESLSAYMGQFQKGFPGHRFGITRVDAHHGRSLARWELLDPNGTAVQRGISYAVHDGEGRLAEITGFFPA
jgi:hypothetical protein